MRARLLVPSLLAVLLMALPATAGAQGGPRGKGGGRAAHPKVGPTETCEACHADATPGPFREWRESAHGLALVKCFVCHGSTGADFKRKPAADRCNGCHAEQVASMRGPAMKGKDCFTCHSAHALNPHAITPAVSTAGKIGADQLAPMVSVEGRIPPPAPQPAATQGSAPAPAQPGATAAGQRDAAAPAQPGTAATPSSAAPPPAAGAPPGAPPAAEKDVKTSQPHPPTER